MDVISILDTKKSYRVLPSKKGLFLHPIKSGEDTFKLCRVEDKTVVKGGHVQLDLHDGTSYLLPEEDVYQTLDILKLSVPDRELLGHTKLAIGAPAIVTGGKNIGKYGKVTTIEKKPNQKRRDLIVTIEDQSGDQFQTILDFVFVLGDTKPSISLPEAD
jgi:small subunit ribosomal protein S4e